MFYLAVFTLDNAALYSAIIFLDKGFVVDECLVDLSTTLNRHRFGQFTEAATCPSRSVASQLCCDLDADRINWYKHVGLVSRLNSM